MGTPTNYTWEERKALLKRTLPPENLTMKQLAKEIGISPTALYKWKAKLSTIEENTSKSNKQWSSQDKFHIVMETYPLTEAELAAYCRNKGLYIEEVKQWQQSCMFANQVSIKQNPVKLEAELKEQTLKAKKLAKELARKEKALAETAALLVLRKKADAIWGEEED